MTAPRGLGPLAELHEQLGRWQAAGLITHEQALGILAAERQRAPARHGPPVGEALGYAGAALIAAAVALIVGPHWSELAAGLRVGLLAGGVLASLVAGVLVPAAAGAAARRVRAVLWALSAGFLVASVGVALTSLAGWRDGTAALAGTALAVAYAGTLWWLSRRSPLHVATFAAWVATATLLGDRIGDGRTTALLAWAAGLAWCGLATLRWLPPRRLGTALGAAAALLATQGVLGVGWGDALGLATVAGVLSAAVALRSIDALLIGAVGAFLVVPRVANRLLGGAVGAGIALLAVGVVLVAAAVLVLRGRRTGRHAATPPHVSDPAVPAHGADRPPSNPAPPVPPSPARGS